MSDVDPNALDPYYEQVIGFARQLVTLIKTAEQYGADAWEARTEIRGQIRQQIKQWESEASPLRTWLLVEVLAYSVAATYEDLEDWSASILQALTEGVGDE